MSISVTKIGTIPFTYLGQCGWTSVTQVDRLNLDLNEASPQITDSADPRNAFLDFVHKEKRMGHTAALPGRGQVFENLCWHLQRKFVTQPVDTWNKIEAAEPGAGLEFACALEAVLRPTVLPSLQSRIAWRVGRDNRYNGGPFFEPNLMLGYVVRHEDHGIGVLKSIDTVAVEGVARDAARREYRNDASPSSRARAA